MDKIVTYTNPISHFQAAQPSDPVHYYSKRKLLEQLNVFKTGFPGKVTYAMKTNPKRMVLADLIKGGVDGFDVASPHEIGKIRQLSKKIRLNYNNPIRSHEEIEFALEHNVRSFSVDCMRELEKLAEHGTDGIEVTIRIKLDLDGGGYNFGSKFGATEDEAVVLLKRAKELGFIVSMTFHVGTQSMIAMLYAQYIHAAADCAKRADVNLVSLNVGGGFPSNRDGTPIDYQSYFDIIETAMAEFGDNRPALFCEPGRALVAEAFEYLVQIKSFEKGRWLFLNDGHYGGLSEFNLMGPTPYRFYSPEGVPRTELALETRGYGPTCDSVDTFNETISVPQDVEEGDYMMFSGWGAYVTGPNTKFNGYGAFTHICVKEFRD